MGFDWTEFGNNFADSSGITGIGNITGISHTGAGGLSGNTHLIGNRLGQFGGHVIDTGEHLGNNAMDSADSMSDLATKLAGMLGSFDPKMLIIGGVALIVIMKI